MSTIDIFSVINTICWCLCVLMLSEGVKTLSKRIDTVLKRLDTLEETNNAKL